MDNTTQVDEAVKSIVDKYMESNADYNGNDNYNQPKSEYISKVITMSDDLLLEECKRFIFLSAYASNNWRSDYHWKCDLCYDECQRRNKGDIYTKAHKLAF